MTYEDIETLVELAGYKLLRKYGQLRIYHPDNPTGGIVGKTWHIDDEDGEVLAASALQLLEAANAAGDENMLSSNFAIDVKHLGTPYAPPARLQARAGVKRLFGAPFKGLEKPDGD